MDEVGPAVAAVDPVLVFAALLGHRGDAAELLVAGIGATLLMPDCIRRGAVIVSCRKGGHLEDEIGLFAC